MELLQEERSGYHSKYWAVGYIAPRKVDEINGDIKVFVEIGSYEKETGVSFWPLGHKKANPYIFSLDDEQEWHYISNVTLSPVPREAVVGIIESLRDKIEQSQTQTQEMKSLLDKLCTKKTRQKSPSKLM